MAVVDQSCNLCSFLLYSKRALTLNSSCYLVSHPQTIRIFILTFFTEHPVQFFLLLDTLFSTFCTFNPSVFTNFCIIGDFNVNYLLPTTPSYIKLTNITSSFSLSQVVTEPTRIASTSYINPY